MKLQDLKHESASHIIELKIKQRGENNQRFKVDEPVRLIIIKTYVMVESLTRKEVAAQVEGINAQTQFLVERIVGADLPSVASVLDINKDIITINIKVYGAKKLLECGIRIGDTFYNNVRKTVQLTNVADPSQEVVRDTFYMVNDRSYCIMGTHVRTKEDSELSNFLVASKEYYIHVKKRKDENEKIYFEAEKVSKKITKDDYRFFLVEGKIQFTDEKELLKQEARQLLEESGSGTYINIWDKYGAIERENVINEANLLGSIRSINFENERGGKVRFDFSPESQKKLRLFQKRFHKGDLLTVSIHNPFGQQLDEQTIDAYLANSKNKQYYMNLQLAEDIYASHNSMLFWYDDELAQKLNVWGPNLYLFMSITGDIKRLDRRTQARKRIDTMNCPMPQLVTLLEGKSVSKARKKKYEALSPLLLEEVFKDNPPTPKQLQAIDIALNTPDIALIQGPPGTGKTTVIRGILERLNEESDSSDGLFGKNLVTAFQHDAVQNAIDRIEILGLPAIKFGRKRGENTDDTSEINASIENWINEKSNILQSKHQHFLNKKYIITFNDIYTNYMYSANSIEQTLKLLEDTRELLLGKLSEPLLEELHQQMRELKYMLGTDEDAELKALVRAIRRILVSEEAYKDDGDMILREVSYKLSRLNDTAHTPYINKLDTIRMQRDKSFTVLKDLRKTLLVMFLPQENIFTTKAKKDEITLLMRDILEFLMRQVEEGKEGKEFVIIEYMQTLQENPLAVKQAILNYTAVNGATNQQVMRKEISDLKGGDIVYDNVLVDEAARSNPLDLFIPLSIARDRIILVGDHRQLPHIVDEQIVRKMENDSIQNTMNVDEEVQNQLKESLFKYLFTKLKQLEKADGIQRTITLDKQYRTHHVLGEFIDEYFYSKYGEKVESPRKAEDFSHQLPGLEDKACVWMEVPKSEGTEQSGHSKSRQAEAEKIAEHIKELLTSEAGKKMSFGIITFYRDQVEQINIELYKKGVFTKDEEDNYELSVAYRGHGSSKSEKIKVGTVDAFQGMEFDVVYLSMVRSNSFPSRTQDERNKKYGFLMYENRMCVSMSRQKKLLIAVGDSEMLQSVDAEEAIRPLVAYYKMCKKDRVYGKII